MVVVADFYTSRDMKDAALSVDELGGPEQHVHVVSEAMLWCIEEVKDEKLDVASELLTNLFKQGSLTQADFSAGVKTVLEQMSELLIDAPNAWKIFARQAGTWAAEDCLRLDFLADCPPDVVSSGYAQQILAAVLKRMVEYLVCPAFPVVDC